MTMPNVAINGLGRIGRATLKILLDHPDLELVAVNDLVPAKNLAYLLQYDTVYGRYAQKVTADGDTLQVGDKKYKVLNEKDPAKLPWKDMGVDVVFECTGVFDKKEDLEKHIQAGAKFAILSAPTKSEDVPTVVHRVNEPGEPNAKIISCASCTTNCISPVVEVMGRRIGVQKAIMTTVHAYTSTQAIVDSPAKKVRRGRAGATNLVPTTTGAAKATAKALPEFKGKFDGVAIRVPVPVGSVADLVFLTQSNTSVEEVNDVFRQEAETEKYKGVMGVSEDEIVSSDIIGDPRASIVDLTMTQVVDGNLVKVMSWYDNEWGYASQMIKEGSEMLKKPTA
jgi:glyceraldehyde 3-phosphate dehydrogenase